MPENRVLAPQARLEIFGEATLHRAIGLPLGVFPAAPLVPQAGLWRTLLSKYPQKSLGICVGYESETAAFAHLAPLVVLPARPLPGNAYRQSFVRTALNLCPQAGHFVDTPSSSAGRPRCSLVHSASPTTNAASATPRSTSGSRYPMCPSMARLRCRERPAARSAR